MVRRLVGLRRLGLRRLRYGGSAEGALVLVEIVAHPVGRHEADDPAVARVDHQPAVRRRRGRSPRSCRRSRAACGMPSGENPLLAQHGVDLRRRQQARPAVAVARPGFVDGPGAGARCHRIGGRRHRTPPYGERPTGPGTCACAPRRQKDQSRRQTHPVNNFITECSCKPRSRRPSGAFRSLACRPGPNFIAKSGGPWAGSRRVCRKSALAAFPPAAGRRSACRRGLSRACVIEKNLAWSELGQYHCLNCGAIPAQGLQRNRGASSSRAVQARPFLRDVERPGLNLRNCGSRRTSGGPVGAASAQGAPTTR